MYIGVHTQTHIVSIFWDTLIRVNQNDHLNVKKVMQVHVGVAETHILLINYFHLKIGVVIYNLKIHLKRIKSIVFMHCME
jgi:hypothetical protein